jgi:hypothetical protein
VSEVSDWLGPDLINLEPPSLDRKSQFMASAVLLSYPIGEPLAEADWPGAPSASPPAKVRPAARAEHTPELSACLRVACKESPQLWDKARGSLGASQAKWEPRLG